MVMRVLLAEDQGMVRGALATLLSMEPDMEVVAQLSRGDAVLEAARAAKPEVALLDIEMPGMDGLSVAARLRTDLPSCAVIILTTFGRPGYLRRAMEAGARGFLVKDGPVEELAGAIRRVAAGERVIDPTLAASALSQDNPLSEREQQALRAGAGGASVADIARSMYLSEGTVRNYLSSAIQKLDARNRIEAVKLAEEQGWL